MRLLQQQFIITSLQELILVAVTDANGMYLQCSRCGHRIIQVDLLLS